MKTAIIVSILVLSISAVEAQPVNNTNKSVKNVEADTSSDRSVELSVGYASNIVRGDKDEIGDERGEFKASGVAGRLSKSINLASDVNTTTGVSLALLSVKVPKEDQDELKADGASANANMYELGLGQRLSVDVGSETILRPFIEANVGAGVIKMEYKGIGVTGTSEMSYYKYGGAVGLQMIFSQTIVPYIMFDYSKVKLDDKVAVEAKSGTQTLKEDIKVEGSRDATSQTLSAGIGFLF